MTSMPTNFQIDITSTAATCPIGEKVAKYNLAEGKIPVLSCEGACIRGEIARLAANLVAKEEAYRRACHGEFLTVPGSTMVQWVQEAQQVVLIDGCFLHCHGRILEHLIGTDRLIQFDALAHYKKYTDRFDIDSVPEEERKAVARDVADWVLSSLRQPAASVPTACAATSSQPQTGCCG